MNVPVFFFSFFSPCCFLLSGNHFSLCFDTPADGIIPLQMETTSGEGRGGIGSDSKESAAERKNLHFAETLIFREHVSTYTMIQSWKKRDINKPAVLQQTGLPLLGTKYGFFFASTEKAGLFHSPCASMINSTALWWFIHTACITPQPHQAFWATQVPCSLSHAHKLCSSVFVTFISLKIILSPFKTVHTLMRMVFYPYYSLKGAWFNIDPLLYYYIQSPSGKDLLGNKYSKLKRERIKK